MICVLNPGSRLLLATTVSLGLVFTVSACGGGRHAAPPGATSTEATAPTLSPAAYRKQAGDICLALYRHKIPSGSAGFVAMLPVARVAYSRLAALAPPPALAKLNAQVLAVDKQLMDFLTAHRKELETANTQTLLSLFLSLGPLGGRETRLWTQLGVPVCANGPLAIYTS
jgi:hypothetical protein